MGFADTLKNLFGKAKTEGQGIGRTLGDDFRRTTDNDPTNDVPTAGGQAPVDSNSRSAQGDKLNEPSHGSGGHVVNEAEDAADRYGKDL